MKHSREHSLGGRWRFRLDPTDLGEHFAEQLDIPWQHDARWMRPEQDDSGWAEIAVPACWQAQGYAYNGVAWYRRPFSLPDEMAEAGRVWLRFDGVDYFADAWLNDHYLGSHEGYFSAFRFEISPHLNPKGPNLLAVRVDSPNDIRARERQAGQHKGLIKGALQRWDANDPEVNPGGIWNVVTLIATGPAAILGAQIQTALGRLPGPASLAEPVPAAAVVSAQVAGAPAGLAGQAARLRLEVRPLGGEGASAETALPIRLMPGPVAWPLSVELPQARLWFTWDLGEPHLYEAVISLEINGQLSDQVRQTFGFRQIERRAGWETRLNGVRFFQRGANYLSDQLPSTMTEARYAEDIELLREANLNTVHPFAVVEKQAFYDACDRAGILVYQDFPMWLTMGNSSGLVRRATAQVEELIAQFGHHPSIGIWNFGSQPSLANFLKLGSALAETARRLDAGRIVHQANALIDPTTPHPDPLDDFRFSRETAADLRRRYDWRADTHQYFGWYWGGLEGLKDVPPEELELVTEYGAQALPSRETLEEFIPADALFPPDWPHYTHRCFQPEYQFAFIEPPASLEQFIEDSQTYQARVVQYHTEHYRLRKFAPCNGAHLFLFNDCWPAITWSVVDYRRRRKAGFYALQRAMSPLQSLIDFPPDLRPGEAFETVVWVVNDFPRAYDDLTLSWSVLDEAGTPVAQGKLPCRIEANSLAQAGSLRWPGGPVGRFSLRLRLADGGEAVAENLYLLRVG